MTPDSARMPGMPSSMHPLRSAGLESSLLPTGLSSGLPSALSPAGVSPALRDRSVDNFAARSNLRTPPIGTALFTLQKCSGIVLSVVAWLIFLAGLAHLILAAVHNQQGELGLGLDSTVAGAKYCLASFVLGGVGLPQWVIGARRLQESRAALN